MNQKLNRRTFLLGLGTSAGAIAFALTEFIYLLKLDIASFALAIGIGLGAIAPVNIQSINCLLFIMIFIA